MTSIVATVPLRQRLMLVALAGVLPVAVAAGIGLLALVRGQYKAAEAKSMEVTRLAAAAMEVEIKRSTAVLHAVASSPALERGDLAGYWLLMTRTLADMPGWDGMVLASVDGRPLVDTRVANGAPLPPMEVTESFRRAVASRSPVVGRLRRAAGGWEIPLYAPVLRDGKLAYVVTALMTPAPFVQVVMSQGVPDDWVMSVFDDRGLRIARSRDHDRYVGTPPAPSLARLMADPRPSGVGVTRSLEGTEVYTAFVRMPVSGWSVAIGLPTADVQAAALRAFALYGGGTALSILIALLLASIASRGISGPIATLRTAAERLGRGEEPAIPPTPIEELQDLGHSLSAAAAAHEQLESERRATLAELIGTRDDLRQQVTDLERLHRLTGELLRLVDLDDQLDAVLAALCELHGATRGAVSLAIADGCRLELRASRGFSEEARGRIAKVEAGQGACGTALSDDCRVVIEDTETDERFAPYREMARAEGFRAVHSTPIRATTGRMLGVLSVHLASPGLPTARQIRLADLCAHLCTVFVERAQAQAEAVKSERRLAIAVDSSIVPFSILAPQRDPSGTIVDFVWEHLNRAAAGAIGRTPSDLVGKAVATIVPEVWETPGLFEACVAVAQTGHPRELEVRTAETMPERWLHVIATPFEDKVAVWTADISERKQQERALQLADRRKDEFLAILAHELRNPLAPIQQAAMIASAPGVTDAQQKWSREVIVRQVRHMSLLLDDLLDVSRITRGKLELRKSKIVLGQAIDAAVETARPHFEGKGHQLVLAVPPAPIHLDADPLRVAQVLTNLLTNAARYTQPGGVVRLTARVDGPRAVVTVVDSGIGIRPAQLDSIFEMFSQGRPGAKHGGLGIGLALSRGIAQLHGGTLVASSPGPGRGACFTLTLPLGEAAPATVAAPSLAAATAPVRILVADDNRDAVETLASLLRLHGHAVRVAYDGESALAACLEDKPDVAILDIGMPRLSGYEVAQRIRAMAAPGHSPVLVALTGWGQAKDKATAEGAGFDHHLTKPVDAAALFAILATPVRRSDAMPGFDAATAAASGPDEPPPVRH